MAGCGRFDGADFVEAGGAVPSPVDEHANSCEACREALDALVRSIEAIEEVPRLDPPAELWDRIEKALENPRMARVPRSGAGTAALLRVAALLALVTFGALLGAYAARTPHEPHHQVVDIREAPHDLDDLLAEYEGGDFLAAGSTARGGVDR